MLFSLTPIERTDEYRYELSQLLDQYSALQNDLSNFSAMMAAYSSGNAVPPEMLANATLLKNRIARVNLLMNQLVPSTEQIVQPTLTAPDIISQIFNSSKFWPYTQLPHGVPGYYTSFVGLIKTHPTNLGGPHKFYPASIGTEKFTEADVNADEFTVAIQTLSNLAVVGADGNATIGQTVDKVFIQFALVPLSNLAPTKADILALPASSKFIFGLPSNNSGQLRVRFTQWDGDLSSWELWYTQVSMVLTQLSVGLINLIDSEVTFAGESFFAEPVPTGPDQSVDIAPFILDQVEPFSSISEFVQSIVLQDV